MLPELPVFFIFYSKIVIKPVSLILYVYLLYRYGTVDSWGVDPGDLCLLVYAMHALLFNYSPLIVIYLPPPSSPPPPHPEKACILGWVDFQLFCEFWQARSSVKLFKVQIDDFQFLLFWPKKATQGTLRTFYFQKIREV